MTVNKGLTEEDFFGFSPLSASSPENGTAFNAEDAAGHGSGPRPEPHPGQGGRSPARENAENDRNWGEAKGKRHGLQRRERRERRERQKLGNGKRQTARPSTQRATLARPSAPPGPAAAGRSPLAGQARRGLTAARETQRATAGAVALPGRTQRTERIGGKDETAKNQ